MSSPDIRILPFSGGRAAMEEIAERHLAIRTWQVTYAGRPPFADIRDSQEDLRLLDVHYLRGGAFLVAYDAQQLVGFVGLRRCADGWGELKRLAVEPLWHGLGLGRRLAAAVVGRSFGLRMPGVRLATHPAEGAAERVYRPLRFTEYGQNPRTGDLLMYRSRRADTVDSP